MLFDQHKTDELVIKPHYSPGMKLFITGLTVVILLVSGGVIYNYGLSMGGFKCLETSHREQDLRNQVAQLETESQSLREAFVRAENTLQIDRTAYRELDQSLKASGQEIVKLREELNFYRNIISPPNKKGGLRVQSLRLESADGDRNTYRYKMVLIHTLKHDSRIRGKARFEISGLRTGKTTVLRFPQSTDEPISFSFKYFQDINGLFELPTDFEPKWIKVKVTARGRHAQTAEYSYRWSPA